MNQHITLESPLTLTLWGPQRTPLGILRVKSDMDVYRGKDRQRMAQPLTATHTTVTNMTRRAEGVEKECLFPPVRPDCSEHFHPVIFAYWEECVTQILDSPLSVRCWVVLGMSHDLPGL